MSTLDDDDRFSIDPTKLPKQLDLELPAPVFEQLNKIAAETGRSIDELILEILDSHLPPY
jgi:hypothetical protein